MVTEPTIQELFDLRGKTALVTGATGHLGQSLARALAEAGANIIVTSRDESRAKTAAGLLPIVEAARHFGMSLDHLRHDVLPERFTKALSHCGSVDVLINNGHDPCKSDLTNCTADEFTRQQANATGYFVLARLLRNHAVEQGKSASVIMLGSMYGVVGSYPDAYEGICTASPVAYHALKGGILQMTRHLAVYWAQDRVRVNALSPGPFPSPAAPQEVVERLRTKTPLRRMGQPHELKGAVVFLASEASSYMTGQNLMIDGGWTAW
jgi:gluconate 5-dehydrogenase